MQPNSIVLSVDEENDGVGPVEHTFTRFEEYQNRSKYIGPNHSMTARNEMALYRTFPKVSGNFLGVAKSEFKFTEDTTVTGADGVSQLKAPMIGDVSFSFPVGTSTADKLKFRQKLLALLDLDTVMTPLNDQLMI